MVRPYAHPTRGRNQEATDLDLDPTELGAAINRKRAQARSQGCSCWHPEQNVDGADVKKMETLFLSLA